MKTPQGQQNIYFLGIGGIGMSALARYFHTKGYAVAGYDRCPSEVTNALEKLGIEVNFDDKIEAIPEKFRDKGNTQVVITPAIPPQSPQLEFFRKGGFDMKKRSQVLGDVTRDTYCIAVAGTHGKTTTTAMISYILKECGVDVSAFVGGIMENYGTNYLLGKANISVVEADEFDRSFLQLSPDIALITSMDADHLDIYGTKEAVFQAFEQFASRLKPAGELITKKGLPVKGIRYDLDNDAADYQGINIRVEDGTFVFDFKSSLRGGPKLIRDIPLQLPGRHNVENAVAALAVADQMGVSLTRAKEALANFKGTKRRFNTVVKRRDFVFVDDYAHHPAELAATISAARELYPNAKITGLFQPHLYTRTRDFADEFARSLSLLDRVLLLDIYPARELPIEGITSQWLLEKVSVKDKHLVNERNIIDTLSADKPEVLLLMGAGNISDLVEPIKKASDSW